MQKLIKFKRFCILIFKKLYKIPIIFNINIFLNLFLLLDKNTLYSRNIEYDVKEEKESFQKY